MAKHSAPSVVYPLERPNFQSQILFGVWSVGISSSIYLISSAQTVSLRVALFFVSALIAGVCLSRYWRPPDAGNLSWDGCDWHWIEEREPSVNVEGSLVVIADFQRSLFLLINDQVGNRQWLFAKQSALPERWLDLRRAVFYHAKSSATSIQPDTDRDADSVSVAVSGRDPVKNPNRVEA